MTLRKYELLRSVYKDFLIASRCKKRARNLTRWWWNNDDSLWDMLVTENSAACWAGAQKNKKKVDKKK